MNAFEKKIKRLLETLQYIGSGFLAVMMFLTAADVFMRYFLNRPITGSLEVTEFMMVIVIFLGVAHVGILKGHTSIDLVISRTSSKTQAVVSLLVNLLCLGFLSMMLWGALAEARSVRIDHIETTLLHIPLFPFVLLMSFGIALFALVTLLDVCHNFISISRK